MLLFELLRIALGTQGTLSRSYSDIEWQDCYNIAEKQRVIGVCFPAIDKIFVDYSLPSSFKLQWINHALSYRIMYQRQYDVIKQLASFTLEHSIKMLLLKGYGLSLNYPIPELRSTGDIDIYLLGQKEYIDRKIEEDLKLKVKKDYLKHSHFILDGNIVENHNTFIDVDNHKSNRRFENILEETLEFEKSPITNCYFPKATWNALFLIRHAGEHFASNEISLRQILDLGTFFREMHDKIDWPFVLKIYEEEGMLLFYDAIASICVRDLKIPSHCFRGYNYNDELATKVIIDILSHKEKLPMSTNGLKKSEFLKYGIKKSMRWWRNRWKYKMVYNETFLESFVFLAKNRVINW